MTDEEIEVVAEELAKIGGVSWYPGREQGTLTRVVTDRYRDRARAAIAALDRFRAQGASFQDNARDRRQEVEGTGRGPSGDLKPGATVIYRPPGDRRAYSCRVVEIQGDRAYLAPILRTCIGWVSIQSLQVSTEATVSGTSASSSGSMSS
jgi:hypothetical protein